MAVRPIVLLLAGRGMLLIFDNFKKRRGVQFHLSLSLTFPRRCLAESVQHLAESWMGQIIAGALGWLDSRGFSRCLD